MKRFKKRHKQTWVKINAPVDKEIVKLIEVLSSFPRLETVESCQGNANRSAWVCFRYGDYWLHPWRDLASFVLGYLGPGLAHMVGDNASVTLQVTEFGLVQGELAVRPGATHATVSALRRLVRGFSNSR